MPELNLLLQAMKGFSVESDSDNVNGLKVFSNLTKNVIGDTNGSCINSVKR
jgi:hypothetical protein